MTRWPPTRLSSHDVLINQNLHFSAFFSRQLPFRVSFIIILPILPNVASSVSFNYCSLHLKSSHSSDLEKNCWSARMELCVMCGQFNHISIWMSKVSKLMEEKKERESNVSHDCNHLPHSTYSRLSARTLLVDTLCSFVVLLLTRHSLHPKPKTLKAAASKARERHGEEKMIWKNFNHEKCLFNIASPLDSSRRWLPLIFQIDSAQMHRRSVKKKKSVSAAEQRPTRTTVHDSGWILTQQTHKRSNKEYLTSQR